MDELGYFCDIKAKDVRGAFVTAFTMARTSLGEEYTYCQRGENGRLSDVVSFMPRQKRNLIVLISGLHGIEGYAGSALQQMFMREFLTADSAYAKRGIWNNTGALIIHQINPGGFESERRVDENNVDPNRAFIDDLALSPEPEHYDEVREILNPTTLPRTAEFYLALKKLDRKFRKEHGEKGSRMLRETIASGQYTTPEGLFYGGTKGNTAVKEITDIFDRHIPEFENIIVVDLHTGYGRSGKLYCLCPVPEENNAFKWMSEKLSARVVSTSPGADSSEAYNIRGDLNSFLARRYTGRRVVPITLEFGTIRWLPEKLTHIEGLRRMIMHNYVFPLNHAGRDVGDSTIGKTALLFKEMFYPSRNSWRRKTIRKARMVFGELVNGIDTNSLLQA